MPSRVIVALDFATAAGAMAVVDRLDAVAGQCKIEIRLLIDAGADDNRSYRPGPTILVFANVTAQETEPRDDRGGSPHLSDRPQGVRLGWQTHAFADI